MQCHRRRLRRDCLQLLPACQTQNLVLSTSSRTKVSLIGSEDFNTFQHVRQACRNKSFDHLCNVAWERDGPKGLCLISCLAGMNLGTIMLWCYDLGTLRDDHGQLPTSWRRSLAWWISSDSVRTGGLALAALRRKQMPWTPSMCLCFFFYWEVSSDRICILRSRWF